MQEWWYAKEQCCYYTHIHVIANSWRAWCSRLKPSRLISNLQASPHVTLAPSRLGAGPNTRLNPNLSSGGANAGALTRDGRARVLSLPQPKRTLPATAHRPAQHTSTAASHGRRETVSRKTIDKKHHKYTYTHTRWTAKQHTRSTSGESRRARSPPARRATTRCRRSWSTLSCPLQSTMPSYTGMPPFCIEHQPHSNPASATRSAKTSCPNSTSATSTSHISSSTTKSLRRS